jgi:ornithine cyclodeaminase/alanine dehydrogenase-like protein (mu-crystallin family)
MPRTLMLTASELRRSVDVPLLAAELREAFAGYREDGDPRRVRARPGGDVTAMVLLPGTAPAVPAYTVKVHSKNPARKPAIAGVICLHDLATGDLLAIVDSGWLTATRTGTAAALGTHILARRGAATIGVIGTGTQGRAQLSALAALRPVTSVLAYDTDAEAARSFTAQMQAAIAVPVAATAEIDDVVRRSDILLVATWASAPVLTPAHVVAGTHVTSLGADEPGKAELDPRLLVSATVVTDDRRLAQPVIGDAHTSLSCIPRSEHPGRVTDDEVTVYSPVGLPMQDCVAAWHAYRRALELGIGTPLDLAA